MKRFFLILTAISFISSFSLAQGRRSRPSSSSSSSSTLITYDLSAASGTYNGSTYTEINLGLNWFLQDWLNWRNSIFSRQGTNIDSVQGLDSAFRFITAVTNDSGSLGFDAFAGPGLRFATRNNNAVFGEAGLIFHLGGLRLGGGIKALNYINDRLDTNGATLPKNDTQFFIILGGAGVL